MSKYFACCERCFETIGKRSTNAAKLWLDLCALRLVKGDTITMDIQDFPELRSLEVLGFVVSTDKPGSIVIKVKGHCLTEDGDDFFCVREGEHEQT